MKILHVPRRFTRSHWGGTETVILETCKQVLAKGHETRVVTSMALAGSRQEEIQGVRVERHAYCYPWLGLDDEARRRLDQKGGNLFSLGLMRALKREPGLDVLHCHTAKRLGGIVRHVARQRRVPYLVSLHGGLLDVPAEEAATFAEPTKGKPEWGKALGWWVGSRRVLDDAAAILCLGDEELRRVQESYPATRAVKFPNGVDPARFEAGDGAAFRARHGIDATRRVVLVVGRIDPQKNQRLAALVLGRLREAVDAHLVLVGHVTNDAYEAQLRRDIEELRLAPHVTLIPGLSPEGNDLADAYHAADVFLLPSIHEPFGIVILEAWAAGRPVVASRVGGVPSILHDGVEGLLFESGSEEGALVALRWVLEEPRRALELGAAGRRKAVEEHSWSSITDRLLQLYAEAIRANPPRQ